MMTKEERRETLKAIKKVLITAHDEMEGTAAFMETALENEAEMAASAEYGLLCQTLGVLEEQIAKASNLLNKIK